MLNRAPLNTVPLNQSAEATAPAVFPFWLFQEIPMRVIPSNTATASLRRAYFTLRDTAGDPVDITVTGVKSTVSVDGGTPGAATDDIVKVSGTIGLYYQELTQPEVNQTAGALIAGSLAPSGTVLAEWQVQIGPSSSFSTTVVLEDNSLTSAKVADNAFDADGFSAALVAKIADGIWDELTAGHTTTGSTGKAIIDLLANVALILADTGTDGVVISDATRQSIGQEVLKTLGMGRGNRVYVSGTDIITTDTDGTTAIATQPFTRLASPANPIDSVG